MESDRKYEIEWNFYGLLVRCGALIVLALITWGIVSTVTDRFGPVKPYQHMEYSWPSGTPSK